MKFNITHNDIKLGKKHDPAGCAIARSVLRKFASKTDNLVDVSVLPAHISIRVLDDKKKTTWTCKMPKRATQFVYQFDNDANVKPFVANLDLKRNKSFVLI